MKIKTPPPRVLDCPQVGGARLVDWCTRRPTRRALKMRSCCGYIMNQVADCGDRDEYEDEEKYEDPQRVGGVRLMDWCTC